MKILYAFLILSLLYSCKEDEVTLPKPRIYPKVDYPTKKYKNFDVNSCPFTMEIPEYFQILKDTNRIASENEQACWYDLYCEELNSYLHLSYVPFKGRPAFDKLVSDAFEMVDKHNIKASYRNEIKISHADKNLYGLLFEIDGPVATPLQFYMTDSLNHFLRGSLYFKAGVNRDSIAPVYDFLKVDINNMIGSFKW